MAVPSFDSAFVTSGASAVRVLTLDKLMKRAELFYLLRLCKETPRDRSMNSRAPFTVYS